MIIVIFIQILTFTYTPARTRTRESAHISSSYKNVQISKLFYRGGYPENVDIWAFCFFDKILRILLYQCF